MKERVEDLGRIAVLVEQVLEHPIFLEDRMEPTDFAAWFEKQDDAKKHEVLTRFSYGADMVEKILSDILSISKGLT